MVACCSPVELTARWLHNIALEPLEPSPGLSAASSKRGPPEINVKSTPLFWYQKDVHIQKALTPFFALHADVKTPLSPAVPMPELPLPADCELDAATGARRKRGRGNAGKRIAKSALPSGGAGSSSTATASSFAQYSPRGPQLLVNALDLSGRDDLTDFPARLALLSKIASRRSRGQWQFELGRELGIEPKALFQHLKPLQKYGELIRIGLPLPFAQKRASKVSGSGVLWLNRFFSASELPEDILHIMVTLMSTPLVERVLDLLRQRTAILEQDVRTLCVTNFLQPDAEHLIWSYKTAAKYFFKVRKQLLVNYGVKRVRAWCPQTSKFELALVRGDVKGETKTEPEDEAPQRKRLRRTEEQKGLVPREILDEKASIRKSGTKDLLDSRHLQHLHAPKSARLPTAGAPSDADEDEDDEECPAPVDRWARPVDALPSQELHGGCVGDETGGQAVGEDGDVPPPGADDDDGAPGGCGSALYELSFVEQIVLLVAGAGSAGVLTPEIAAYVGIPGKRLIRLLETFEAQKVFVRRAQRIGKHFVYKYYDAAADAGAGQTPTAATVAAPATVAPPPALRFDSDPGADVLALRNENAGGFSGAGGTIGLGEVETATGADRILAVAAASPASQRTTTSSSIDRRTGLVRIRTEQFSQRLAALLAWLPEKQACVIPDLIKRLAELEPGQTPLDRKTVLRLVNEAQRIEPRVKAARFENRGPQQRQAVSIIYWGDALTAAEAKERLEKEITERRSEGCKDAIRKNLSILKTVDLDAAGEEAVEESKGKYGKYENGKCESGDGRGSVTGNPARDPTDGSTFEGDTENESSMQCSAAASGDVSHNEGTSSSAAAAAALARRKREAVERMNRSIEQFSAIETSMAASYNAKLDSSLVVHLDVATTRQGRDDSRPAGSSPIFSQKVLGHYGFVFPSMIRLRLFHKAVVGLGAQDESVGRIDAAVCARQSATPSFTTREIMQNLTLETFLRTIGCGYQHAKLDDFLRENVDHYALRMRDLPPDLYFCLAEPRFALRQSIQQAPYLNCKRMLERLATLGLLELEGAGAVPGGSAAQAPPTAGDAASLPAGLRDVMPPEAVAPCSNSSFLETAQSSEAGLPAAAPFSAMKSAPTAIRAVTRWRVLRFATIRKFVRSASELPGAPLGTFDLAARGSVSDYWRRLKAEIDRWMRTHDELPARRRACGGRARARDYELPANFSLASAFAPKNWKTQILLDARVRKELEGFGDRLIAGSGSAVEREVLTCAATAARGGAVEPAREISGAGECCSGLSECANYGCEDLECEKENGAICEMRTGGGGHGTASLNSTPVRTCPDGITSRVEFQSSTSAASPLSRAGLPRIVVNPHSDEIRDLSARLRVPADAVVRYLLRYMHVAHGPSSVAASNAPLLIHLSREVRYRCHLCGMVYVQNPSIVHHYRLAHGTSVPADTRLYLLDRRGQPVTSETSAASAKPRRRRSRKRPEPGGTGTPTGDASDDSCDGATRSISKEARVLARAIVDRFTREDDFLFLLGCVVGERLMLSRKARTLGVCGGAAVVPGDASAERATQRKAAAKCIVESEGVSKSAVAASTAAAPAALPHPLGPATEPLFDDPSRRLPKSTHPVWGVVARLLPRRFAPARPALAAVFRCLLRLHPRNLRLLSSLRRVPVSDLCACMSRLEVPALPQWQLTPERAVWSAQGVRAAAADAATGTVAAEAAALLVMKRVLLKSVLLSPAASYSDRWFYELARTRFTDAELKGIWRYWNAKGFVVQVKAVFPRGEGDEATFGEPAAGFATASQPIGGREVGEEATSGSAFSSAATAVELLASGATVSDGTPAGDTPNGEKGSSSTESERCSFEKGEDARLSMPDGSTCAAATTDEFSDAVFSDAAAANRESGMVSQGVLHVVGAESSTACATRNADSFVAEAAWNGGNADPALKPRRKYVLGHLARLALLGKFRDHRQLFETSAGMHVLADGAVGGAGEVEEPADGAAVAALFEGVASGQFALRLMWDGEGDFYADQEREADESLERILMGVGAEGAAGAAGTVGRGLVNSLSDSPALRVKKERGELDTFCAGTVASAATAAVSSDDDEGVVSSDDGDGGCSSASSSDLEALEKTLRKKTFCRGDASAREASSDSSSSSSDADSDELVQLPGFDGGALFDEGGERTVFSRAIEGGIDKHLTELTEDVPVSVAYSVVCGGEVPHPAGKFAKVADLMPDAAAGPFPAERDAEAVATAAVGTVPTPAVRAGRSVEPQQTSGQLALLAATVPAVPGLAGVDLEMRKMVAFSAETPPRRLQLLDLRHYLAKSLNCNTDADTPDLLRASNRALMDRMHTRRGNAGALSAGTAPRLVGTGTKTPGSTDDGGLRAVLLHAIAAGGSMAGPVTRRWAAAAKQLRFALCPSDAPVHAVLFFAARLMRERDEHAQFPSAIPEAATQAYAVCVRVVETLEAAGELGVAEAALEKAVRAQSVAREVQDCSVLGGGIAALSTPVETLFESCLRFLEASRCIMRVPFLSQWRYVSSTHAAQYCFKMRGIPEPLETPPFVPEDLWLTYGPLHRLCFTECFLLDKDAFERSTACTAQFDEELLQQLLGQIRGEHAALLAGRLLAQGLFMEVFPGLKPLPADVVPAAPWVMLDGHFNLTFMAIIVARVLIVLRDYPACTVERVAAQLGFLDSCETDLLLRVLAREGFVLRARSGGGDLLHFRHTGPFTSDACVPASEEACALAPAACPPGVKTAVTCR